MIPVLFHILFIFITCLKCHFRLQVSLYLVNDYCNNDHKTSDNFLPELCNTAHSHTIIDHTDYKCTDNSTANASNTT